MRYVATIELYVHGDTPKEAMKEALDLCKLLNHEVDCQAEVYQFHRQEFGTLSSYKYSAGELKLEIMNEELDNTE